MSPEDKSLTLRQQYEASRSKVKGDLSLPANAFLRPLVGCRVTVRFPGGEEITDVFTTFDKFTIKLGAGTVVFKHAIQTIRQADSA